MLPYIRPTLGQRLKSARMEAKLSQRAASKAGGVDVSSWSRVERGAMQLEYHFDALSRYVKAVGGMVRVSLPGELPLTNLERLWRTIPSSLQVETCPLRDLVEDLANPYTDESERQELKQEALEMTPEWQAVCGTRVYALGSFEAIGALVAARETIALLEDEIERLNAKARK
jgi:transcriptional regulator with XRE-family HTH domain